MLSIQVSNVGETSALASILAELARPGDVITLSGELGVGKSEFARAFIQAAVGRRVVVPSPTFTLLQQYESPKYRISHFDLYRISESDEVYELGFEEALLEGVTLIEWPERLGEHPLNNCLDIEILAADNSGSRLFELYPDETWQGRIQELGNITPEK